jgi:hypothetical protein
MATENKSSEKPFRLEGYPLSTRLHNLHRYLLKHQAEPGLTEEVENLAHCVQSLESFALEIFAGIHESSPDYLDYKKSQFGFLHRYDPVIPLDTTFDGYPPGPLGRGMGKAQKGGGVSLWEKILLVIGIAIILWVGYRLGYNAPIEVQVETWKYQISPVTGIQEAKAIDCGWRGGYVGVDHMKVEFFSCAYAFGSLNHEDWTYKRYISTETVTTCRRWLRGEGYCDGSGRGRANSQAELWGGG